MIRRSPLFLERSSPPIVEYFLERFPITWNHGIEKEALKLSSWSRSESKNPVTQGNKWHKGLEVPIFRCMAGRCQSGWRIE
jgi:hypothetical protein